VSPNDFLHLASGPSAGVIRDAIAPEPFNARDG
jgi:hypothetical protein